MSKLEYSKRRICVAQTDLDVRCECSFWYLASPFWDGRLQIRGGKLFLNLVVCVLQFLHPLPDGRGTKEVSGGFDLC